MNPSMPLYPEKDLSDFNRDFAIARITIADTPIPSFLGRPNFYSLPYYFQDDRAIMLFKNPTGKSPEQQVLSDIVMMTAQRVHEVIEYDNKYRIYDKLNQFRNEFASHFKLVSTPTGHYTGAMGGHEVIVSHRDKTLASTVHKLNIGVDEMKGLCVGELKIENIADRLGLDIEVLSKDPVDSLETFLAYENFLSLQGAQRLQIKSKMVDFKELIDLERVRNNENLMKIISDTEIHRKTSTSDGYSEVIRPSDLRNGLSVEAKFTLDANKNQHGINFTGLYEYWQKYLKGYAAHYIQNFLCNDPQPTKEQIKIAVEHFMRNMELIIAFNPEKKLTSVDAYKKELYGDFLNFGYIQRNQPLRDDILRKGIEIYFYMKAGYLQ